MTKVKYAVIMLQFIDNRAKVPGSSPKSSVKSLTNLCWCPHVIICGNVIWPLAKLILLISRS